MRNEIWAFEDNPSGFLDYRWHADEVPARKFYLFLVEIGRQLRSFMTEPGPIAMLGLCEQCAEGQITEDDLDDASYQHQPDFPGEDFAQNTANNLFWWVPDRYKVRDHSVEIAVNVFPNPEHKALEWGALVRDIHGPNPFHPVAFAPEWRTDTVFALAREMYESRDFSAMPILADALQDAGCDSADVLNHCRDPHAIHVRGCWVVDGVLNKT